MSVYTLKCDLTIKEVTVGKRPLLEIITASVMQGLNEAGVQHDPSHIKKFVSQNTYINFEIANIPFRILLQ